MLKSKDQRESDEASRKQRQTSAHVVEASSYKGCVIWTLQLRYPRFIHSEFMTHRVLSRNASSSRAIPVSKMLKQVWFDPAEPVHFGRNQSGMQAREELQGWRRVAARGLWRTAAKMMCGVVWVIDKLGGHKQWANRLLEPWQYIHVIVTATEWENLFSLRRHPDAQPEFKQLADDMHKAMSSYEPRVFELRPDIPADNWHLPYVTVAERTAYSVTTLLKLSAARCARVSYLTHDKRKPLVVEDEKLYDRLVGSVPIHASPIEHQATPNFTSDVRSNNFKGWIQYRDLFETKQ